jgi:hypothetical protein
VCIYRFELLAQSQQLSMLRTLGSAEQAAGHAIANSIAGPKELQAA